MDPLSLRFLRITLHAFAHTLGSVGIVLELRGCAGCRACAHLLGKRNGTHSELRWGNAVRVKSYFVHLRWRDDFRKRRGDEGRREPKSASSGMKNAPPLNHAARFGRRGAGWRVHPAVVGRHDHEDRSRQSHHWPGNGSADPSSPRSTAPVLAPRCGLGGTGSAWPRRKI